ncbi:MAG: EAL domain-containing protein [Halioglobus sp.]|nr:EAL domain-containing protein [Halioglobus sp.]
MGAPPLVALSGIALSVALALLVLLVAISRDKSRRRADRMAGLYYALSQVNQAIVRMDEDRELFPLVCRMAVDYGGMAMAWIGQLEPQSGDILPVASHGEGEDALQRVTASSLPDRKEGQGPTGTALRENRAVIVNDFMRETGAIHWHKEVRRLGWRAAAVFPLLRNGQPFAVFSVYHRRPGAFDDEAINLLREMSADISFALDNFDREEQRRAYEQALAESEARLSTILDNVGACIYLKDTDGCYTYVNQEVLDLWGVTRDEVIGRDDTPFFDARSVARLRANDERVLRRGQIVQAEETHTVKVTGKTHIYWSVKLPLRNAHGDIYALCGISTDVTEKKTSQQRLHYLSNYDELTGLPNRAMLQERARLALAQAKAADRPVALLYIDLDRFKLVNDSLGHGAGDRMIKEFSRRLTAFLHLDVTLSRAGGDEFYLLLPGMERDAVLNIAGQVLEMIARPVAIDGQQLTLSASIGAAFYPEHGGNLEELVQCADTALAQAKSKGRHRIEIFTDLMRARARKTLLVESELRDALEQGQLLLHYQPQVDMGDGRVTGLEALIRWQHPQQGLILPGQFIPVAEESSLIVDIGTWVLKAAAQQQALWQAEGATLVPMAVNLSVVQLYRDDFGGMVEATLKENGLSPGALELEITEGVAMEHSAYILATLGQLQALGVRLVIDDFGTGYSSLSYLKRFPVYKLKIDKSFVDGLADSAEDQAIVTAIIGMARGLGFTTVAEGVETREQWEFLRDHGCDEYQGYYFSKPGCRRRHRLSLLRGSQGGSANNVAPRSRMNAVISR